MRHPQSDIILFPNQENWYLISAHEDDWGELPIEDMISVLSDVTNRFKLYFGEQIFKKSNLIIYHSDRSPTTYREIHAIALTATDLNYEQLIYQFAHELFHFTIKKKVLQKFRWLEESICEAASLFFLKDIASQWEKDVDWKKSAVDLQEYYKLGCESAPVYLFNLDARTVAGLIKLQNNELQNNEYNRKMNNTIASAVLPIFEYCPLFWSQIPKLCKLDSRMSLNSAIAKWALSVDQNFGNQVQELSKVLTGI